MARRKKKKKKKRAPIVVVLRVAELNAQVRGKRRVNVRNWFGIFKKRFTVGLADIAASFEWPAQTNVQDVSNIESISKLLHCPVSSRPSPARDSLCRSVLKLQPHDLAAGAADPLSAYLLVYLDLTTRKYST